MANGKNFVATKPTPATHAMLLVPSAVPAPTPAPGFASKTIVRKWGAGGKLAMARGAVTLYPTDFVQCPDNATITCLTTVNPKRGNAAPTPQQRLQAVINGTITTVGQYRKAYGIALANADFSWDVNRGYYVVNWQGLRGNTAVAA